MFLIDIQSDKPFCGNCVFGEWDCSDSDYDLHEWFSCRCNSVKCPDDIEDILDEQIRASSCGCYTPLYADKCHWCGKPMNHVPIYKVHWWAISLGEEACCSEKCRIKRDNQIYWELCSSDKFFFVLKTSFILKYLLYKYRALIAYPEPTYD